MPHIDLPADLNFVDDDGLHLARLPDTGAPAAGAVLLAGTSAAWSWAVVEDVDDGWVRFRPTAAPGPFSLGCESASDHRLDAAG